MRERTVEIQGLKNQTINDKQHNCDYDSNSTFFWFGAFSPKESHQKTDKMHPDSVCVSL